MALWLAWRFGWRWRGVGCWRRGVGCWSSPCAVSRMQRVRVGWPVVVVWYTSGRPVLPVPVPVAVVAVSPSPVAVSLQVFPVRILFPIFSPDPFPDILPALSIRSRSRWPVGLPEAVRLHPFACLSLLAMLPALHNMNKTKENNQI